jgi:cell division protein FtsW
MRFFTTFSLLSSIIGLSLFSLVFIYSCTIASQPDLLENWTQVSHELKKQLVFYLLGFIFLIAISRIPYQNWIYPAIFLYLGNLTLLVLTSFPQIGTVRGGARSWIDLGFTMYQPSETMKTAWLLYLASYLRYRKSFRSLPGLIPPFLITGIPFILVFRQPDFGTAFIYIPTLFVILYLVGAKLKHLGLIILTMALVCVPVWTSVLTDRQKNLVYAFLDPDSHALSSAYQMKHSILAIGEGHWTGKGVGMGRVNRLNLLPEAHTDFIFSIIAEELGLVGALGLLLCYLIFLYTCYSLAAKTREPYGKTLVIGVSTLLTTQALINICVAIGILPTTGITLPFVSSGGSSYISCCIMVGLVLSVAKHHVPVLSKEDFR